MHTYDQLLHSMLHLRCSKSCHVLVAFACRSCVSQTHCFVGSNFKVHAAGQWLGGTQLYFMCNFSYVSSILILYMHSCLLTWK